MATSFILLVSFIAIVMVNNVQSGPVEVPLVDKLDAPLKAEIDISRLNEQLKDLIKSEVNKGFDEAVQRTVDDFNKLSEKQEEFKSDVSELVQKIQKESHGVVAFLAKNKADLTNIASKARVVYDYVVTNLGNGYDSTTGIFTAPTDGVYSFSWTVLCQYKKNFYTYLTLNGKRIARNYSAADSVTDHVSATQTVILQMKRNNKVNIQIMDGYTGQYMYGGGWSTFSGFRL